MDVTISNVLYQRRNRCTLPRMSLSHWVAHLGISPACIATNLQRGQQALKQAAQISLSCGNLRRGQVSYTQESGVYAP
jgi:hypothetical protein